MVRDLPDYKHLVSVFEDKYDWYDLVEIDIPTNNGYICVIRNISVESLDDRGIRINLIGYVKKHKINHKLFKTGNNLPLSGYYTKDYILSTLPMVRNNKFTKLLMNVKFNLGDWLVVW